MSLSKIISNHSQNLSPNRVRRHSAFLEQAGEFLRDTTGSELPADDIIYLENMLNDIYSVMARNKEFTDDEIDDFFIEICSYASDLARKAKSERLDKEFYKDAKTLGRHLIRIAGKLSGIVSGIIMTSSFPNNFLN